MDIIKSIFPFKEINPFSSDVATNVQAVKGFFTSGILLLFVGVIIGGVVFAGIAGFKFISSRGEDKQIIDAQKAAKQVLIGVAVAFIGAVAVIAIASAFTDGGNLDNSLTCLIGTLMAEPIANCPGAVVQ